MAACRWTAAAALLAALAPPAGGREREHDVPLRRRTPFTYLFDTRTASGATLGTETILRRTGWKLLPADDLSHKFTGDAVACNDKLLVVLRRKGLGAEVYRRTDRGCRLRAVLLPCAAGDDAATGLAAVTAAENTPAAVMLAATYKTRAGKRVAVSFRLTAGMALLEVRPGDAAAGLRARDGADFLLVPDFFAEDFAFVRPGPGGRRVGLPAENCLLSLLRGGDDIAMYVWPSSRQNADVLPPQAGRDGSGGCQIEFAPRRSIWLALLHRPGIWHARDLAAGARPAVPPGWKPPFPAKWRCAPVAGAGGPVRAVVYPIDRTQQTPLNVFCPMDAMRNALGVGPCQYVLQAEGLGGDAATPAFVARWIERQLDRKRTSGQVETVRERLEEMVRLTGRVRGRIAGYGQAAKRIRADCAASTGEKASAGLARDVLAVLDEMDRHLAAGRKEMGPATRAAKLAGEIAGSLATPAECRRLCGALRALGEAQDRVLARCRMAARRIKQRCRSGGAGDAELARRVGAEVEKLLHRPAADGKED